MCVCVDFFKAGFNNMWGYWNMIWHKKLILYINLFQSFLAIVSKLGGFLFSTIIFFILQRHNRSDVLLFATSDYEEGILRTRCATVSDAFSRKLINQTLLSSSISIYLMRFMLAAI